MGGLSLWHWAILIAVILLVFGSTRIPGAMTELAKGIKAFRANVGSDSPAAGDGTKDAENDPKRKS